VSAGVPRLRVEDLRICLEGTEIDIVDGIGFELEGGKLMGLVGESGSGKSTIGLALLGYTRRGAEITAGRVLLDGQDVLALKAGELRRLRGGDVAYVPQDPGSALNPARRIGAQIEEVLDAHPGVAVDPGERVRELMEEVDLPADPGYLRRYPHQLSGGQQQRVTLAMAFSCRPRLIVLDEPTTGLDVSTQRHILATIQGLCATYGVAGVYVSHDLAVVGEIADSVAVLYGGRLVELGRTDKVFGEPAHPYTCGLFNAIPRTDRAEILLGIPGQPPRPGSRPHGCTFAPRCPMRVPACEVPPPMEQVAGRAVRCIRAEEALALSDGSRTPTHRFEGAGTSALRVSDLVASYRGSEVLHGVSFDVPRETCTAVVGESGSGKTTLARCVAGLHSEFSGSIELASEALAASRKDRSSEDLRRVQLIFQSPYNSLNPRKRIGEIVGRPLAQFYSLGRGEREARVDAVLEDVSLPPGIVDRYPDELSGGERQRIAIARALVVEPELLICDEVTSALDVSVQAVIVELLRKLQAERNLSLLFITHNLAVVRSIAQSVVVLQNGHIVESGPVEAVFDSPQDPYTIRLMDDVTAVSV
jgi:peptide/nickel transport system ATP-binding protein